MDDSRDSFGVEPERLEQTSGGGCLMLFGLPFLAAGLAMLGMPWFSGEAVPVLAILPFGLVFTGVGAGIALGRSGVVADRSTKTLTKWWGLVVPFKRTVVSFGEISAVTICREVRRSKNSTYTVFPVRIRHANGEVNVEEARRFERARARSEEFAKFLNVDIEDTSTGTTIVRKAGTFDESLRDRLRREGRPAERPVEPPGCRVVSSVAGTEASFALPARGFGIGEVIGLGVLGIWTTVWAVVALGALPAAIGGDDGMPLPVLVFMVPFGLLWFGLPLLGMAMLVNSARAIETVTVSPRELRLQRTGMFGAKSTAIPSAELEELHIGGADDATSATAARRVVIARSDRATIQFGSSLGPNELTWLHDVVRFIMTA
jgi:hypothetical protein